MMTRHDDRTPPAWPRLVALLLLAAMTAAGCGARDSRRVPPGTPDPDRYLFERGTESLENRRWLAAREFFRHLLDTYPQSTYRADAKLGVGDSFLGERTIEGTLMAVNEFREFLAFYPTHPRADYAQYNIGLAHYNQMRRPERDQTETKEAIREFELFLERYPTSPLAGEAREKLREARDRLSESEYRVGLFYFRARWYPGAIHRFRGVIDSDPGYTGRDAVYYYLAESLVRVQRPAEALPYYERLVQEFEQSEFLTDAKQRIAELKVDVTAS